MKHKTFSKENEKKLKQIIKAQKDELRRLEIEIRDLKQELHAAGKPKKPKEAKPPKEVKQPPKQVDKGKAAVQMSDDQRKAFCEEFSRRFKQSRGNDGSTESSD